MMGIIPDNTCGFGDAVKAAQVFVRNELTPLQKRIKEINEWIEDDIVQFKNISFEIVKAGSPAFIKG